MKKETRYQGAIVRDYKILLICHREHGTRRKYRLLPGGRIEPGESERECVRREIKDETGLDVDVDRLLGQRCAKNIAHLSAWSFAL